MHMSACQPQVSASGDRSWAPTWHMRVSHMLQLCHIQPSKLVGYESRCTDSQHVLSELQVQQGEVFVSETDTEVIPKLCKWVYHSMPQPVPFSKVGVPGTSHLSPSFIAGAAATLALSRNVSDSTCVSFRHMQNLQFGARCDVMPEGSTSVHRWGHT